MRLRIELPALGCIRRARSVRGWQGGPETDLALLGTRPCYFQESSTTWIKGVLDASKSIAGLFSPSERVRVVDF